VLATLPLTLPVAVASVMVYSAYSGVKKVTPYSPDKNDVVSSKINSAWIKTTVFDGNEKFNGEYF